MDQEQADEELVEDGRELVAAGAVDADGHHVADDAENADDSLADPLHPERCCRHVVLFVDSRVDLVADHVGGGVKDGPVRRKVIWKSIAGHVGQHGLHEPIMRTLEPML